MSTPICELVITYDGSEKKLSFKLLDHQQRKLCMKQIYNSMLGSNKLNIASNHFELLGMDMILNERKLNYILKNIYSNTTLQLNQIKNFYGFISNMTYNQLQIKYILSDKQLYKPLISFIVTNISKYEWLFALIVRTIQLWKQKHYLFAIKNGLCQSLLSLTDVYRYHHREKIISLYKTGKRAGAFWNTLINDCKNQRTCTKEKCRFELFRTFYLQFHRYFAKKNDRKTSEMFCDTMKSGYSEIYRELPKRYIYAKYYYKQMNYFIDRNYLDSSTNILHTDSHRKCGYIKCDKSLCPKGDMLYVCKGCKLVTYCNRNHQKKSWNALHREQCLRKC
eukprot:256786_1